MSAAATTTSAAAAHYYCPLSSTISDAMDIRRRPRKAPLRATPLPPHSATSKSSSSSAAPRASDALPLPLFLTNGIFFTLFFSVAYFLLHRWREKIHNSVPLPLHVLTLSEIAALLSLIASFIYLLGFFGIDFVQSVVSKSEGDIDEDRSINLFDLGAESGIRIFCRRRGRRRSGIRVRRGAALPQEQAAGGGGAAQGVSVADLVAGARGRSAVARAVGVAALPHERREAGDQGGEGGAPRVPPHRPVGRPPRAESDPRRRRRRGGRIGARWRYGGGGSGAGVL